jgi:hypothetical protein
MVDSVFDLDHITALWFVTSPLAIPCVILGMFCWAVAIMLVAAETVMMDRIKIDAMMNGWGVNNILAIEMLELAEGLECLGVSSVLGFIKLYSRILNVDIKAYGH